MLYNFKIKYNFHKLLKAFYLFFNLNFMLKFNLQANFLRYLIIKIVYFQGAPFINNFNLKFFLQILLQTQQVALLL